MCLCSVYQPFANCTRFTPPQTTGWWVYLYQYCLGDTIHIHVFKHSEFIHNIWNVLVKTMMWLRHKLSNIHVWHNRAYPDRFVFISNKPFLSNSIRQILWDQWLDMKIKNTRVTNHINIILYIYIQYIDLSANKLTSPMPCIIVQ